MTVPWDAVGAIAGVLAVIVAVITLADRRRQRARDPQPRRRTARADDISDPTLIGILLIPLAALGMLLYFLYSLSQQ